VSGFPLVVAASHDRFCHRFRESGTGNSLKRGFGADIIKQCSPRLMQEGNEREWITKNNVQ
jgi:hypothetical protein